MFKRMFRWKHGIIPVLLGFIIIATIAFAGTPARRPYGIRFQDEGAAHSTPPSGYLDLYVNSDVLYTITDGGTVTSVMLSGTAWDDLSVPDNDESLDHTTYTTTWDFGGTADMFNLDFTGNFADVSGMVLEQKSGTPTDGTLLELIIASEKVDALTIYNSDTDLATANTLLTLDFKDNDDAQGIFIQARDNSQADTVFQVGQGGDVIISETTTINETALDFAAGAGSINSGAGTAISILPDDGATAGEDFIVTANNITINAAGTLAIPADGTLAIALDMTDADITTGLSVAANKILLTTGTIEGGAATIDFTDFDVDSSGNVDCEDLIVNGNMSITGSFEQSALLPAGSGAQNITLDAKTTGTITIGGASTGAIWLGDNSGGATAVTVGDGTDVTIGEGSLTIDNDQDEDALVITSSATTNSVIEITNAATTTGKMISANANDLGTAGVMLYLDTDNIASNNYYIALFDGTGGYDFSVSEHGAVAIEGNSTSDVLTLTAGDMQIEDGIFEVDTNEDVTSFVQRTQGTVTKPVLSVIEQSDADAGSVLFIDNNSTTSTNESIHIDSEGGIGIYFENVIAAGDIIDIDVVDSYTGQGLIADLGPWLGTSTEGFIDIVTDSGTVAEVGNAIRIDLQGTTAPGSAVTGHGLWVHEDVDFKSTQSLVFLDSENNIALEIFNSGTAADGIKMEVADAYNGQGFVADLGEWPGTVTEGFINIESDAHATAQLGQVIRINLQNTSADTSGISGKAIYAADASTYKEDSYLIHIASANSGAAWFDGEVDFKLDTSTDDIYVTSNATDYAAGSGILSIYDDATGQDNASYMIRLAREASADTEAHFLLFEDNSSDGAAGTGDDMFIVAYDGATTITGRASGTDALTLTAGDILVTAGHIDITTGNLTVATGNISLTTGNLQTDVGHAAIGIGTADIETWETSVQLSALQLGGAGFWAAARVQAASDSSYFGHNAYLDDTDSQWEAISTADSDQAVMLQMTDGTWIFNVEDTAIAGDAAITWIPSLIIEETGDVGIGPATAAAIDTKFHIESADASEPVLKIQNTTSDANGPGLVFSKNDGVLAGSGDDLGTIRVESFGDAPTTVDVIKIEAAAAWGGSATDSPTSIKFYTVPDSSETATLALTIESDQDILGAANIAGLTYGSDSSISDAELLALDDGATTEILVGGGAGVIPVWTTASGTGAPVRVGSPTFTTQLTTPKVTNSSATTLESSAAGVIINTHTDATDDVAVNTTMLVVEGDTGQVGMGTAAPNANLHVEEDNAATNTAIVLQRLSLTSTGTPAANLGPSLEFEVEAAAGAPGNQEVIAAIDAILIDVTSAAEGGAIVFKTMGLGATADEDLRIADHEIKATVPFTQNLYYWVDEFDDCASGDEPDEEGAKFNFYTVGGTNEADNANFAVGIGGILEVQANGALDNDSTFLIGEGVFAESTNVVFEARIKVDDITTVHWAVGLVEGSYVNRDTFDDDIMLIGQDTDTAAANVYLITNDNAGGAVLDDTGIDAVNNTYLTVRAEFTDTEQPRVWINGTEIAAGSITGTIQAGTTLMPYIMIQNVAGAQRKLTIDFLKVWQDRG